VYTVYTLYSILYTLYSMLCTLCGVECIVRHEWTINVMNCQK
jgi:hypothetical protein